MSIAANCTLRDDFCTLNLIGTSPDLQPDTYFSVSARKSR